jgi:hypothetical protein
MVNPFKKKSKTDDKQKLGMLQRVAMKKAMNMNSKEREKIISDAMKPENRDKLLKTIAMMEKSGMVSKEQIEQAKKQLGI